MSFEVGSRVRHRSGDFINGLAPGHEGTVIAVGESSLGEKIATVLMEGRRNSGRRDGAFRYFEHALEAVSIADPVAEANARADEAEKALADYRTRIASTAARYAHRNGAGYLGPVRAALRDLGLDVPSRFRDDEDTEDDE